MKPAYLFHRVECNKPHFRSRREALCVVAIVAICCAGGKGQPMVERNCNGPLCAGSMLECEYTVTHSGEGPLEVIDAGLRTVVSYGRANVFVPTSGCSFSIERTAGNTTCHVGGELPCSVGPGGSTEGGLPGDPFPGEIAFSHSEYKTEEGDSPWLMEELHAGLDQVLSTGFTQVIHCFDGDPCTVDVCTNATCSYLAAYTCNGDMACADCNLNGIRDACELLAMPSGLIASRWVGEKLAICGTCLYGEPSSWCPPVVPRNGGTHRFSVLIPTSSHLTLDTSMTIDRLELELESALQVDAKSGAVARTIIVSGSEMTNNAIWNSGQLRALDGVRLILDAPAINQGVEGSLYSEGAGSRIEIRGATVSGGTASTFQGGQIRLAGGAELHDVDIAGDVFVDNVLVPRGQTAAIDGQIHNEAVIAVGESDATSATFLVPSNLAEISGSGCVLLKNRFSRLGDFEGELRNMYGHRIEGAGRIFGKLTNEYGAMLVANHAKDALYLIPPGSKLNSGYFLAAGGILQIEDAVSQTESGSIEVNDGGTVRIAAELSGGSLVARDGEIEVRGTAAILAGTALICPPVGATAGLGIDNSVVAAKNVQVCQGGRLVMSNSAELHVANSFAFTNVDELEFSFATTASIRITGGLGRPDHDASGYAQLEVGGADFGTDPSTHKGSPVGFVANFALPELVVGAGAHVSLFDRWDNWNRGPEGTDEALYVEHLRFGDPAARLNTNGLNLYYNEIEGDSMQIISLPRLPGDYDADGDLDLVDFAGLAKCFGTKPLDHGCRVLDGSFDNSLTLKDARAIIDGLFGPM